MSLNPTINNHTFVNEDQNVNRKGVCKEDQRRER